MNVTQNDITQHDVTQIDITQHDVTQHDVSQNSKWRYTSNLCKLILSKMTILTSVTIPDQIQCLSNIQILKARNILEECWAATELCYFSLSLSLSWPWVLRGSVRDVEKAVLHNRKKHISWALKTKRPVWSSLVPGSLESTSQYQLKCTNRRGQGRRNIRKDLSIYLSEPEHKNSSKTVTKTDSMTSNGGKSITKNRMQYRWVSHIRILL